jgi:hypothetical protein
MPAFSGFLEQSLRAEQFDMAAKKSSPVMDFVTDYLKKQRDATFAEIRDAAAKKRMTIYPIVYGRAQALLGIVKSSPRGEGKAARVKAAKLGRPIIKRGPGRPRSSGSLDSLDNIITAVKQSQADQTRYRSVLEKIQGLLQDALA